MKNNKYQTIDITASLDVVDNSFAYKTKEDIDHLCVVLKNQAREGADIQGFIYVNRNILKAKIKNINDNDGHFYFNAKSKRTIDLNKKKGEQ